MTRMRLLRALSLDLEPVRAFRDFRLIFDHITPVWNQQYPTVTVTRVQTR